MRAIAQAAAVALLMASGCVQAAGDYWAYAYQSVDATTQATPAYTVNLVRYCARLDALLVSILGIRSSYRMPTHLYVLPAEDLHRMGGGDYEYVYDVQNWENTVLITAGSLPEHRHYYGAFFGYTASLLGSDRRLGGPDWYMDGVPAVFADTIFERGKAKIGNISGGFAWTLVTGGSLYPMRRFLSMRQSDAEHEGEHQGQIWQAESWYLARLVFVEGRHRPEFLHYLDLLRDGQSEAQAFGSSFKFSYEDLDHELAASMRDHAHVYILDMPPDPGADEAKAVPLSAGEWKGRLALAYATYHKPQDALRVAAESLRLESDNQSALRAQGLAQLELEDYAAAQTSLARIRADSPGATLDRAHILEGLAQAAAAGKAQLDATQLRAQARAAIQQVLGADAGNRAASNALNSLGAGP